MKFLKNPLRSALNFDEIRKNAKNIKPDEKYRGELAFSNFPKQFSDENPFILEVEDIDTKKPIKLNIYLNRHSTDQLKGMIVVNHGFNAHAQKYFQIAQYFSRKGFDVWGYDMRGYGKSEGYKGYLHNDINIYIDDVYQFVTKINQFYEKQNQQPVTNKFMIGQSLGGLLAINTAIKYPDLFKGLVVLAPALKDVSNINPFLKKFNSFLTLFMGRNNLMKAFKSNVNKNPAQNEDNQKDPLFYGYLKPASIKNVMQFMKNPGSSNVHSLTTPFLCFHGTADKLTDLEGSFELYEKSKSDDKTLYVVEDLFHNILYEKEIEEIVPIIDEWIHQRI